jgi:hypothetical protein
MSELFTGSHHFAAAYVVAPTLNVFFSAPNTTSRRKLWRILLISSQRPTDWR